MGTQRCWAVIPKLSELTLKLWKQKRRGSMSLPVLIPKIRPSHCPYVRISNVQACPRQR